ncbi:M20/M25/M40 family metallo-hydrolase [Crassaminicella indica]|uniref:M20/M25/M40 family metallo-hydrolase n=1 Tax=Crassaminicella indica TaxID=2855394 RepID=A0ABX8RCK4_9CLOT|nr:M20/M25/M40 family metallo-hydrolase [Crassaminicella indica]QXM06793.1 M20/M25/M40 family metallo-hydrolase [Crassaminicella indica]
MMNWNSPESIKKTLFRMVACSSVSGTKDEINMAKEIYNIFNEMTYFKENPKYLSLNPIPHDPLGRYFVTALVKGKGDKTVVFINHMDTVDYNGFGPYKALALDAEKLTRTIDPDKLPKEARDDLLTGDWIFGRGIMDMKCGGALEIGLLGEVSENVEAFEGNLLFLSVPDEENNSAGMIGAIPILNKMKEEYELDYVAVINNEPHPFIDGKHDLHIGSMGKVLPVFYCMGKETHAGQLLQGLNADLLLADIQREMELNMELVDGVDGEYTYPPTALKMSDTKELYNVSTPHTAYAYYNVLTLQFTPKEIMEKLVRIAEKAFNNTLNKFKDTIKAYKEVANEEFICPWEPKVYTYEEIYKYNVENIGESFVKHMEEFIDKYKDEAEDERDFAIQVMGEACRLCPDRDPKIIIGFAPPYYPHVRNKGETEKEKRMLECVDQLIKYSKEKFNVDWRINKFYKQLSDMSYCGVQDAQDILEKLKPNMPTLGYTYFLPLEEMAKFNSPVLNLGPWGKDLHKFTERLHAPFAFEVMPKILKFAIMYLLSE